MAKKERQPALLPLLRVPDYPIAKYPAPNARLTGSSRDWLYQPPGGPGSITSAIGPTSPSSCLQ